MPDLSGFIARVFVLMPLLIIASPGAYAQEKVTISTFNYSPYMDETLPQIFSPILLTPRAVRRGVLRQLRNPNEDS
ncbi:hypothetical protein DSCO28_15260 [Desulfosarcina ovata subsp. sediminis]|uniref:Uncharacterized protein n=1 Tax=Desulfosarcina ovata subsp. sediminis TaxID=885957 RepID=A0A5K7ZPM8_9BACT|nr:hypothetical protein DSCO28_15260 [Desulfosarcina ovata subsp. sediminis]